MTPLPPFSLIRARFNVAATAAAALAIQSATANDTAVNAAAYGPEPVAGLNGEESVIRMESEKIDITFGREEAKVHCRFVFRSGEKSREVKQILGFPDHEGNDVNAIIRMVTKVDGKEVASQKQNGWFRMDREGPATLGAAPEGDETVKTEFHTVPVTFPPDRDVIVERIYTVANGSSVRGDKTFYYTTRTGGVWRGTIGRAEFTVTLDGWTVDDLAFEDGPQTVAPRIQAGFSSPNKSEWTIESPTRMTLVWKNFEPAVHQTRQGIRLATWVGKDWRTLR